MSGALDMSLDDIIKNNKKSGSGNPGGRGRGRGYGPGPARHVPNRGANRASPYAAPKAPETTWQHDMYADQGFPGQAGRASAIETGTKLYISNLDYGVSNEDLKELFSEVGDLKRYSIHYDKSGRSKGTAEIVFSRGSDAVSAVKRYNGVQLDGKPMKIEIVGTNITTPAVTPAAYPAATGAFANPYGVPRGGQGRGVMGRSLGGPGARGRSRPGRGGGGGRGNKRGDTRGDTVSAEDLDADLDKYHTSASMETN